jgi:hypothetical protein
MAENLRPGDRVLAYYASPDGRRWKRGWYKAVIERITDGGMYVRWASTWDDEGYFERPPVSLVDPEHVRRL